ncbi:T-box transcription factor tbx5 [Dinochytrium kinnereticum]|nr:T-box transcription factor tbx5 [Dinochytrium kinnereticum]
MTGLKNDALYSIGIDIVRASEHRYRYKNDQWKVLKHDERMKDDFDDGPCGSLHIHASSPLTALDDGVFRVTSFFMYQPRIHLIEHGEVDTTTCYEFRETSFIAVTHYQNHRVNCLKKDDRVKIESRDIASTLNGSSIDGSASSVYILSKSTKRAMQTLRPPKPIYPVTSSRRSSTRTKTKRRNRRRRRSPTTSSDEESLYLDGLTSEEEAVHGGSDDEVVDELNVQEREGFMTLRRDRSAGFAACEADVTYGAIQQGRHVNDGTMEAPDDDHIVMEDAPTEMPDPADLESDDEFTQDTVKLHTTPSPLLSAPTLSGEPPTKKPRLDITPSTTPNRPTLPPCSELLARSHASSHAIAPRPDDCPLQMLAGFCSVLGVARASGTSEGEERERWNRMWEELTRREEEIVGMKRELARRAWWK